MNIILDTIDKFFHVTKSGSSIKTEIYSGLTAYLTVVYILFLIPSTIMYVFPQAFSHTGEMVGTMVLSNGITANEMLVSLTIAACITSAIGTFIMAFTANLPFAQAPSLSISTFIVYTICIKMGYSYNEALAAVFIGGIIFLIISILNYDRKIQDSIPSNIKFAVTAGIGIFIAFIGMQKAHIVESNDIHLVQLVDFSNFSSYNTKSAMLCLGGVILIAIMIIKHVHGAILFGKLICIILAFPLGLIYNSSIVFSNYNILTLPTAFKLDFVGLFTAHNNYGIVGAVVSVVVIIASLMVMDVFETIGTIIATDHIISYSKDGTVNEKLPKILKSDAIATIIGSSLGITNISTAVESTTMAIEGGRTGLSGIITGILFLLTILIAPYASIVPSAATATTLIISGVLMINVIKYVNFEEIEEALPAFLTMIMIPLSYNLVTGVSIGLISYACIKIFTGHAKEVKIGTYTVALIFILQFVLMKN